MKDRRNLQRALYVFYTVPRGYIKCIKLHFSFIVEDYVRLPRATDVFYIVLVKSQRKRRLRHEESSKLQAFLYTYYTYWVCTCYHIRINTFILFYAQFRRVLKLEIIGRSNSIRIIKRITDHTWDCRESLITYYTI